MKKDVEVAASVRGCGFEVDDERQLQKLGAQWADRLGLGIGSGWTIFYRLVVIDEDADDADGESGDATELGHNDCDWETKTSVITIYRRKADACAAMFVFEEETLIHELLHCKFPIVYDKDSYSEVVLASLQHQVLNDVAHALFLTRYGLTSRDYNVLCRR